jgi:hypothetical protein
MQKALHRQHRTSDKQANSLKLLWRERIIPYGRTQRSVGERGAQLARSLKKSVRNI